MSVYGRRLFMCFVALGLAVGGSVCIAQDKGTQLAPNTAPPSEKVEAPAAVVSALIAVFPDVKKDSVTVSDTWTVGENKICDVAFSRGDRKCTGTVTEAGIVMVASTSMTVAELPKAAGEAVAKAAEGATVTQVWRHETFVKSDDMSKLQKPLLDFIVVVTKDGKTAPVGVTEDGSKARVGPWREVVPKPEEATQKPTPAAPAK